MPTYEYECRSCGYKFEAFQKMTDKPLAECPKCKKVLRRLIGSGMGIIFKGSGFYATDYRKGKPESDSSKKKDPSSAACAAKKEGCDGCGCK
ncbi:MAG: FmdB family zinc ribbon protein [Candidatus Omnitrophota bacterium]